VLCASLRPHLELWLGLADRNSFNALIKQRGRQEKTTTPDHQEGRNYARLPGHDASWTRHYTGSRALFLATLSPVTAPSSAATTHRGPPIRQPRIIAT